MDEDMAGIWADLGEDDRRFVLWLSRRLLDGRPESTMTVAEAAEYTGYSESSVTRAYKAGYLVGHVPRGLTKGVRFRRSDLDAWKEGR